MARETKQQRLERSEKERQEQEQRIVKEFNETYSARVLKLVKQFMHFERLYAKDEHGQEIRVRPQETGFVFGVGYTDIVLVDQAHVMENEFEHALNMLERVEAFVEETKDRRAAERRDMEERQMILDSLTERQRKLLGV